MKNTFFALTALFVCTGLLNGCSSGNPTAPDVSSNDTLSVTAVQEIEVNMKKASGSQAYFVCSDFKVYANYDTSGRMLSLHLEKMRGLLTQRFVIAQVQSLATTYYAPPPVPLTNATGFWGSESATLKIGLHADGNIIYVRQINSSSMNIFCYKIYSQTQYSSRLTSYPFPIIGPKEPIIRK
jgi:hypothetical protein